MSHTGGMDPTTPPAPATPPVVDPPLDNTVDPATADAEAIDAMPVYVVATTPDGPLLSHESSSPEDDTLVWKPEDGVEQSVPFAMAVASFDPGQIDITLEPDLYVPPPDRAAVTAALDVLEETVSQLEGLFAVVAALNADPVVTYPSGLTEDVLRGAVAGNADGQAAMIAVFEANRDPKLSPDQFATKILGDPPAAGDPLSEAWQHGFHEAKLWQAQQMGSDAVTAAAPTGLRDTGRPQQHWTPALQQQRLAAAKASAEARHRRAGNHVPPSKRHKRLDPKNVAFLNDLAANFKKHGVIVGKDKPGHTVDRGADGSYMGNSADAHENFLQGLRDSGFTLHVSGDGSGYADRPDGKRIPIGAPPEHAEFDETGHRRRGAYQSS